VLEYQVAMVSPALAVVDQGYSCVEAAEATTLPRVLESAKPGCLIHPTGATRGIATGLDPDEDSLAARARISLSMLFRATDGACISGHGSSVS
jgi:hypothetical protein